MQGGNVSFERAEDPLSGSPRHLEGYGTYVDFGLWSEARWRIADGKLTLKPALRFDYLGTAYAYVVEPRLAATHELAEGFTLRTTMGYHHQPPGPITAIAGSDGSSGSVAAVSSGRGKVVQGLHTSVGARVELPGEVVSSVTAYHVLRRGPPGGASVAAGDDLDDLIDTPIDVGPVLENVIGEEFSGVRHDTRRGAGVELSVQRRTERWLMWVSYTLSSIQTRPTAPSRFSWTTMNLDQTHNLNLVASVKLGSWRLGARFRYTTGFPYTPRSLGVDDDGQPTVIHGEINSARLAPFRSLDLRVDRMWRRRWGELGFFLDVQNATNARNEEGVNYVIDFDDIFAPVVEADVQVGLPILPMIGIMYQPPD